MENQEPYRHEEYDLFSTTNDDDEYNEWIESLWNHLEETNEEHEGSNTATCHRTFVPYQEPRPLPSRIPTDDYSHPFYRYVTTNDRHTSDNDTVEDIPEGNCNQLYSIVEETECQVREEVKAVSDRLRRRKRFLRVGKTLKKNRLFM